MKGSRAFIKIQIGLGCYPFYWRPRLEPDWKSKTVLYKPDQGLLDNKKKHDLPLFNFAFQFPSEYDFISDRYEKTKKLQFFSLLVCDFDIPQKGFRCWHEFRQKMLERYPAAVVTTTPSKKCKMFFPVFRL